MTHLWVRAEQRPNEERAGVTAEGVKALIASGIRVTVEEPFYVRPEEHPGAF